MTRRDPATRKRPTLTVTIDAERYARLRALVGQVPGGSLSGIVDDLLGMSLPVMEEMVAAYVAARRLDGSYDEAAVQRRIEAYIGATLLKMHNWAGVDLEGGDPTL